MLLLLIVLFLPMQWGAPAGDLLVLNYVVEIIPNVSGEVTEVPVNALDPLSKGDVIFQIDQRPFQAEVDRLQAALAAAKQEVPQLKAAYDSAAATLEQSGAQRDLAKLNYDRAISIQNDNPGAISQLQVDQASQSLAAAEAAVKAVARLLSFPLASESATRMPRPPLIPHQGGTKAIARIAGSQPLRQTGKIVPDDRLGKRAERPHVTKRDVFLANESVPGAFFQIPEDRVDLTCLQAPLIKCGECKYVGKQQLPEQIDTGRCMHRQAGVGLHHPRIGGGISAEVGWESPQVGKFAFGIGRGRHGGQPRLTSHEHDRRAAVVPLRWSPLVRWGTVKQAISRANNQLLSRHHRIRVGCGNQRTEDI